MLYAAYINLLTTECIPILAISEQVVREAVQRHYLVAESGRKYIIEDITNRDFRTIDFPAGVCVILQRHHCSPEIKGVFSTLEEAQAYWDSYCISHPEDNDIKNTGSRLCATQILMEVPQKV